MQPEYHLKQKRRYIRCYSCCKKLHRKWFIFQSQESRIIYSYNSYGRLSEKIFPNGIAIFVATCGAVAYGLMKYGWALVGGLGLVVLGVLMFADDITGVGVADDQVAASTMVKGFYPIINS